MNRNLKKGDLAVLEIVQHSEDDKKFCIRGRFKGYRKFHILARIGEGKDDFRTVDEIKRMAASVADQIQDDYSLKAFISRNNGD